MFLIIMGFLRQSAILLAFIGLVVSAYAESFLFNENFDTDPPYADYASLPHGYGEGGVLHSTWINPLAINPDDLDRGTMQTVPDQFFSSPRSLRLQVPESGKGVNVMGAFSFEDSKSQRISTSNAITFQCTFRLENIRDITRGDFRISITSRDIKEVLAQVAIHKNGSSVTKVNFGGKWEDMEGEIMPDKWYRIKIVMPADPANEDSEYVVHLYDASDQAELGTAKGKLRDPSTNNEYMYFSVGNSMSGTSVYLDDIQVTVIE